MLFRHQTGRTIKIVNYTLKAFESMIRLSAGLYCDVDKRMFYMTQGEKVFSVSTKDAYVIAMSQVLLKANCAAGRKKLRFYLRLSPFHGISVGLKKAVICNSHSCFKSPFSHSVPDLRRIQHFHYRRSDGGLESTGGESQRTKRHWSLGYHVSGRRGANSAGYAHVSSPIPLLPGDWASDQRILDGDLRKVV